MCYLSKRWIILLRQLRLQWQTQSLRTEIEVVIIKVAVLAAVDLAHLVWAEVAHAVAQQGVVYRRHTCHVGALLKRSKHWIGVK